MNNKYQQYLGWLIFGRTDSTIEVYSLMYRIYQMLGYNDFDNLTK